MKNYLQKLCLSALLLLTAHAYSQAPKLNSLLSAAPTIFLDFDGQTVQNPAWQSGLQFTCAPSTMNAAQITEIFNRVSEDYRPFSVNITTDSTVYFLAPVLQRVRMIVTPTSAWMPNVGGVTYVNCFTWGSETPGFVFEDKLAYAPKYIGECCTHESGHAVGLSHQSRYDSNCNLLEPYHSGTGTGQTSWAPVMGNSYYKNMTGWSDGPTPYDCSQFQDNLTIITTMNGFTYRPDDYTSTKNETTTVVNPVSFNIQGIISTPNDKDAFKLTVSQTGQYHFQADPYSINAGNDGADLDIMLSLYDNNGNLIRLYNPLETMSINVDTTLNAGTYYLQISGAGNNNTSNYGSLGSYTFLGFKGALAIHSVTLSGANEKNQHKLNWEVIADEPLSSQQLEVSTNGYAFQPLAVLNGTARNYSYSPAQNGTYFYRVKTNSVISQSKYSNIVVLKATGGKLFEVSTFVQDAITVTASEGFNYNLYDANARLITSGKMQKGSGAVNVQNLPKGMYILQMMNDNYKQTERIIKQ